MMDIHSKLPSAFVIQMDEAHDSRIVLDYGSTGAGLDKFMEEGSP